MLIQRGDLPRAEALLREEIRRQPSAHGRYLLGFTQIQQYQYDEAESLLREAVREAPGNANYRHVLAKSLLEQGKNKAAIEGLNDAIAIERRPEYFFARAMCALNVADFEGARADLEATLSAAENNAEAWFQLGRLRVNTGEYADATAALRRALALQPRHLEARYYLGLSEKRSGEGEAAIESFEQLLSDVPGHVGALMNLGQLQMRSGDKEAAKRTLARFSEMSALRDEIEFLDFAVKKNPDNVNGRLELARKQLEIGDHAEATEQLLAARRLQPARVVIYELLAEAFGRQAMESRAQQAEAYAARLQAQQAPGDRRP